MHLLAYFPINRCNKSATQNAIGFGRIARNAPSAYQKRLAILKHAVGRVMHSNRLDRIGVLKVRV